MTEHIREVNSMHQDHREWQSDYSMWRMDIESWRKQSQAATKGLEELTRLVAAQNDALFKHGQVIDEQEEQLISHERELARCEKLSLEYDDVLTQRHMDMRELVERARGVHEQIKKDHHAILARIRDFVKSLS